MGPSFQEVVPDQEVQPLVKEASYQVVVGVVENGIFQEAKHRPAKLELRWILEQEVVALEEEAQEPFLGSHGLAENSYCQW